MLHIHGTEDPIWKYETTSEGIVDTDKLTLGAEDSVAAWAVRNGCSTMTVVEAIADTIADDTSSERIRYQGCDRLVDFIRVDGGGVGVQCALVVEGGGRQADQIALIDYLVYSSVHRRRHVVHSHQKGVASDGALIVGHAHRDGYCGNRDIQSQL